MRRLLTRLARIGRWPVVVVLWLMVLALVGWAVALLSGIFRGDEFGPLDAREVVAALYGAAYRFVIAVILARVIQRVLAWKPGEPEVRRTGGS